MRSVRDTARSALDYGRVWRVHCSNEDLARSTGGLMLQLGDECVSFEKGSTLAETFFDNLNERICSVRGNGAMGITGKSLGSKRPGISVRIRDSGRISILKFNSNDKYLAVQRHESSVDIIFIDPNVTTSTLELNQPCKMKTAKIKGVEWVAVNQFLLITSQGLELYQIEERKHAIKLLKTLNISHEWSMFSPRSSLLILATGIAHSALQPMVVKGGQFHRLAKFEVDFGLSNANLHLQEQNVSIEIIYGKTYVRAMRFSRRDASISDVVLYEIPADPTVPAPLKYVLGMGLPEMVCVHVIDSLVVVHMQMQHQSMIFDVGLKPNELHHMPFLQVSMEVSPVLTSLALGNPPPLYSHSWVTFSPDIVIDPDLGLFSKLTIQSEMAETMCKDTETLLYFLLNRSSSKKAALRVLLDAILARSLRISQLTQLFDWLNDRLVATVKEVSPTKASAEPRSLLTTAPYSPLIVRQEDLQSHVLIPASEKEDDEGARYLSNVMLTYVRSLKKRRLEVHPYLIDTLVEQLVRGGEMSRLHQLVTYRTIEDSNPLAFLLLSYEARYPPLFQAGIDMLMRSGKAGEEIAEVLLAKGHLVEALRYMDSWVLSDRPVAGLRVLEAAQEYPRPVRHALLSFFQQQRRNKNAWPEQFRTYEEQYKTLFSAKELEEAERDVAFGDASLETITI